MIYWYVAIAFFVVSFTACMYSMFLHEKEFSVFHGILERAGVCFVVAVAWPISLTAIIALAVSDIILGRDYE